MWEAIKNYYTTLGLKYNVDPVIFVGIHIVATPLFIAAVAWIVTNHKKKRSIFIPSLVAAFVFNAANIYLIIFGKNIPYWIYLVIGATTLISSYFSIQKIRKKMHQSD
ncbi:MAG: hypothetical protein H0W84_06475 [Bacteroidetes bacterium]|nr:hypothetical protein [Bacteroidota bacterium]MDZ4663377.1 hypothetical protein [Bacteroidota bacterium]